MKVLALYKRQRGEDGGGEREDLEILSQEKKKLTLQLALHEQYYSLLT